jgi:hypothetical protein
MQWWNPYCGCRHSEYTLWLGLFLSALWEPAARHGFTGDVPISSGRPRRGEILHLRRLSAKRFFRLEFRVLYYDVDLGSGMPQD